VKFNFWNNILFKNFLTIFFLLTTLNAEKPNLLLLKSYKNDINVSNWLISEKLDGVRAYWNGKELISRSGKAFAVPDWFVKDFPPFEIDGELWTKRGDFENIISIVNKQEAHEGWRAIGYHIFEVPHQEGGLLQRLNILETWLEKNPNSFIKIIPQKRCKSSENLKKLLDEVDSKGAEGLVVRNPETLYMDSRSNSSLKVKKSSDDECIVTGYTKGNGKFQGLVGALLCKWKEDKVLKIGSGLSVEDRKNPPKVGDEVTFKYNGLTKYGNPKYPVFLRVREKF